MLWKVTLQHRILLLAAVVGEGFLLIGDCVLENLVPTDALERPGPLCCHPAFCLQESLPFVHAITSLFFSAVPAVLSSCGALF